MKYNMAEHESIVINRRTTIKDLISNYMTSDLSADEIYTEFLSELQDYVKYHEISQEKATRLHLLFSGATLPLGNRL